MFSGSSRCLLAAVTATAAILIPLTSADGQTPGPDYVPQRFDPYTAAAALWRTDGGFESRIRLKNVLTIAPMDVRLTLYMADGTPYALAPVHLSKSGVATISVNNALESAPPEIAAHISDTGSATLQYRYDWAGAVIGSISVLDTGRSLQYVNQFVFGNGCVWCSQTKQAAGNSAEMNGVNTLEGLWWKHSMHSSVWLAIANPTAGLREGEIIVLDRQGREAGRRQFDLDAHARTVLLLDGLTRPGELVGGARITYPGEPGSLLFTDRIEDARIGYSAQFPLMHPLPVSADSPASSCTIASAGLMIGTPAPMQGFPPSVSFSLFGYGRNLTAKPVSLRGIANWMDDHGPHSMPLRDQILAPGQARDLNLKEMVRLPFRNGMVNIAFTYDAPCGSLLLHSGSIDQSGSYVFEVPPEGVGKKWGQLSQFWEVDQGTDTMYTVWNLSPEAEDLIVTIYFEPEGVYRYPLHLEPNASVMLSMLELIRKGLPDPEGHVIPLDTRMGSLSIKNHSPDMRDVVAFVVSSGIYNATIGTCCNNPTTCHGATGINSVSPAPFTINVGGTQSLTLNVGQDGGGSNTYTTSASWSSNNTSVITMNKNTATGVAAGTASISGSVSSVPIYVQGGVCPPASCPSGGQGASASATVNCPHITNFTQTYQNQGSDGTLIWNYIWSSSELSLSFGNHGADSTAGIGIGPAERFGRRAVGANIYLRNFRARSTTDVNTPRAMTSRWILANQISTWFSHDE
jgi:hypothetical protein